MGEDQGKRTCDQCGGRLPAFRARKNQIPFMLTDKLPVAVITTWVCGDYCSTLMTSRVYQQVVQTIGTFVDVKQDILALRRAFDSFNENRAGIEITEPERPNGWTRAVIWIGLAIAAAGIGFAGWLVLHLPR